MVSSDFALLMITLKEPGLPYCMVYETVTTVILQSERTVRESKSLGRPLFVSKQAGVRGPLQSSGSPERMGDGAGR